MTKSFDFSMIRSHEKIIRQRFDKFINQNNIQTLAFLRVYNNGEHLLLTNKSAYFEYKYVNENKFITEVEADLIKPKFNYFIDMNGPLKDAFSTFDTWYPVDMFKRYQNYYEMLAFSTNSSEKNIANHFVNETSFYETFFRNFKDQLSDLIEQAEMKKFILPEKMCSNVRPLAVKVKNNQRFYLKNKEKQYYLTKQELFCAYFYIRGYSAKKISEKVSLKKRTIESYIENMKIRLNCFSKSDLISKILDSKILESNEHLINK